MSSRWPADRLDPAGYVAPGIDLPVFYGDLDTNRHLNNVALGRFFEQLRYLSHTVPAVREVLQETGGGLLVARVAIDYLNEGAISPPIHVRIRVAHIGRTSMREEFGAWQGDVCLALAECTMAYRENGVAAPWPDRLRAYFDGLRGPLAASGAAVMGDAAG